MTSIESDNSFQVLLGMDIEKFIGSYIKGSLEVGWVLQLELYQKTNLHALFCRRRTCQYNKEEGVMK